MTGLFRPGPGARLFVAGLMLAGVFAFQVAGQTKGKKNAPSTAKKDAPKGKVFKADIAAAAVQGKLDQTAIELEKKAAVKYEPFKYRDPSKAKTEKNIVKPETKLPALPNGKVLTAKQYFDELSKHEKGFTKMGHSLRHKGQEVKLMRSRIDAKAMEQRAKELKTRLAKFDKSKHKFQFKKREEMASQFKTSLKDDKKRVEAVRKFLDKRHKSKTTTPAKNTAAKDKAGKREIASRAPFTPKGTTKQWNWLLGKKNLIAGEFQVNLETKGSDTGVSINGKGALNAYLVNNKISVLNATGNFTVPRTGKSRATVNVYVFGGRIYNLDKEVTTSYTFNHSVQKSIKKGVKFRFALGPVPMAAEVGIQGTVGMRMFIGLSPLNCNAQVVPFGNVSAYAEAGVDIVVASAKAGGKLTLLKAELRVGGSMSIRFDQKRGAFLSEQAFVYGNLEMLSGSLYVYLETYVPRFGIPPWTKKRWTFDLWKWKGIKHGGYLVNVKKEHDIPG